MVQDRAKGEAFVFYLSCDISSQVQTSLASINLHDGSNIFNYNRELHIGVVLVIQNHAFP